MTKAEPAQYDMEKSYDNKKITVFYDGACPACVKDRKTYESLAGKTAESVEWFDITGKDEELISLGIDPDKALIELHVKDNKNQVHRELDAYILLMNKVPSLKPLSWLISLPVIRPLLSYLYARSVKRRLIRDGRLQN